MALRFINQECSHAHARMVSAVVLVPGEVLSSGNVCLRTFVLVSIDVPESPYPAVLIVRSSSAGLALVPSPFVLTDR